MPDKKGGSTEVQVPLSKIGIRRRPTRSIAIIGNPNSGKSTLFNRLTGLSQSTGNYPGVTVEKHVGTLQLSASAIEIIDLPGIYCLSGLSTDEQIAVDVLLGRIENTQQPCGLLVVLDATHLYQGLFLLEQLLEMQIPTVVALSMTDLAHSAGISVDTEELSRRLGGIPVCKVIASSSVGLENLKQHLENMSEHPVPEYPGSWPALSQTAQDVASNAPQNLARIDVIQGLLHPGSQPDVVLGEAIGGNKVNEIRSRLFDSQPPQAVEARHRYKWIRAVLDEVQSHSPVLTRLGAKSLAWLNKPWPATLAFFVLMALVFQAVFSWATPIMDMIDAGASSLGSWVQATLGASALSSFIADGVIAGVGSVIVFLPQITILFLFVIILEDSGYLARAAFLMDRVMRSVGLSGQSVIPMLSSFACAVPAIMATRVIPNRRDRIATILAAPFMTCSARLPIYALLIAAFVPSQPVGWFNLQGLILFGLYILGILGGLVTALLLKKSALRGPNPAFSLALPEFRKPNIQTVLIKLWARIGVFLKRAGTIIFAVAIVVWFLAYFPRLEPEAAIVPTVVDAEGGPQLSSGDIANELAALQMSQSWLGRAGRKVEPIFEPLGWDWRVTAAVIAGFPAREVVVAVMGTLYAIGSDADEAGLSDRLRSASHPDGRPVFTLPMVLGLLVFYAWCLQCAATVATIRRETNSWRWPVFAWSYMTILGYVGALLIFQFGSRL
jgi:ferrous iron transport protein B